ncbi:MAG TPA: DUF6596 domain-containing protein [Actinophytocola sp.]|nr:DUF6596 domain-containing protein [Actinophytocola sp.]
MARNCAVDLVRHDDDVRAKLPLLVMDGTGEQDHGDDELALVFLRCHPGLPPASQVVLTLRTVGGLGAGEVGAALLSRPATVAQRLVRAKRWLRDNTVPLEVDVSRVDSVLAAPYLLFNAGYDAADGDSAVRGELCGEAIRLCGLLCADRRTDLPRTRALLALMLLQGSRLRARTDAGGDILLLSGQERTRWDRDMIAEGTRRFGTSCTGGERSGYHVEAAIALCHSMAPDVDHTDWARIVTLYDDLLARKSSPVAALNRVIAAALAGAAGPPGAGAARTRAGAARLPPAARRPRRAPAAGRRARRRRRLLPGRPHQADLRAHPAVPRTTARPMPPGRVTGQRSPGAVDNQGTPW